MLSEAPMLWLLEERWLLKAAKNKCSTRPTEPTASAAKSTNVLSAVFVYLLLGLKTDYKPHFFEAYFCLLKRARAGSGIESCTIRFPDTGLTPSSISSEEHIEQILFIQAFTHPQDFYLAV